MQHRRPDGEEFKMMLVMHTLNKCRNITIITDNFSALLEFLQLTMKN